MILLLVVTYIAYIGLGVPDSLFGSAWPAIYTELGLPVSVAGYVTAIICGCTVISSLCSAKLTSKFGLGTVVAASTMLTAVAVLLFSFANNGIWLFVLAFLFGFGAGAIDAGLNNFVATHYSAMQLNLLHCFYGIGVSFSPYVMSLALGDGNQWRMGYKYAFVLLTVIAFFAVFAAKIWNKAGKNATDGVNTEKQLSLTDALKIKGVKPMLLVFFTSDSILYICGTWGSTFLVEAKGFSAEKGAVVVMIYYVGLALGRLTAGFLTKIIKSRSLVLTSAAILLFGIIMAFMSFEWAVFVGLFLCGFGVGPIFPNMTAITPKLFGKTASQIIVGMQTASCYLGMMTVPTLFGIIAEKAGLEIFPYFLTALFIIMTVSFFNIRRNNNEHYYNQP